jgi:hypothetical protein
MPWLKILKIEFGADVEAEIEAAKKQFHRFDDGMKGLVWLLERNARPAGSFPTSAIQSEFMYGFNGDRDLGIPDMWVVYKFDDDAMTILAINAMESSAPAE